MATALPARYTPTAITLHWLLAVAIVGALGVGLYSSGLPVSPRRLQLINWHKWAGVTILALSALRLLWRLTHHPPEPPAMPAWQRRGASATHALLYALFFAVPLAGWGYSSAAGFPVVLYGVLPLPDFVGKDRALADALRALHGWLAYGLAALVVLHVGAAAKHQLVDRDGLVARMWPQRTRSA